MFTKTKTEVKMGLVIPFTGYMSEFFHRKVKGKIVTLILSMLVYETVPFILSLVD